MSPSFDASTVKLIITLATPHQPVILIDKNLKDFYHSVDTFWQRQKLTKTNRLENLTMISVGGGIKDILVRPELTFNELADLNVLVSTMCNVYTIHMTSYVSHLIVDVRLHTQFSISTLRR